MTPEEKETHEFYERTGAIMTKGRDLTKLAEQRLLSDTRKLRTKAGRRHVLGNFQEIISRGARELFEEARKEGLRHFKVSRKLWHDQDQVAGE